jgi:hypothetical protein
MPKPPKLKPVAVLAVAIAPFAGGKPRVKVRNAFEPDWYGKLSG